MKASKAIWAENYRPTSPEDYVFPDEDTKESFLKWVDEGVFPNLILVGIQGTGKSSLANVLTHTFEVDNNDILKIDGARENKIETVRDRIEPFTKVRAMSSPFRVVLIEESHRFSNDAQSALLEIIEHRNHVRFIFTTNYVNKLVAPLKSRCQMFHFSTHDAGEVMERLLSIAEAEGIDSSDDEVFERLSEHYDAHYPDIRAMINSIQAATNDGVLGGPRGGMGKSGSEADWEAEWVSDFPDFDNLLSLCDYVDENNAQNFYTILYENVHRHFLELMGEIVPEISDTVFKSQNSMGGAAIQSMHMKALIYKIMAMIEEA